MLMTNKITAVVCVLALVLSGLFFVQYQKVSSELAQVKTQLTGRAQDTKVVAFLNLFIDKVLKAKSEIDFETRLQLENAVRELNNPEILAQWRKFVESPNESQAQLEVKDLLALLARQLTVK